MTEVLTASGNGGSHFTPVPLHRSSSHSLITFRPSSSYLQAPNPSAYRHGDYGSQLSASAPSSAPSSPQIGHHSFSGPPSYASTPASSLSLDPSADLDEEVGQQDDDIPFPSFEGAKPKGFNSQVPVAESDSYPDDHDLDSPRYRTFGKRYISELNQPVNDDQAIEDQPTRHVDYLSHEWREEDLWSSWRYIVSRRKAYTNSVRLENASWRTWIKTKYRLKTVSPETLNWYVDPHHAFL
jgi:hypothetical protein